VDAGDLGGRAARDGRGRLRAVPHSAGPAGPHAARPRGDARGLRPPGRHPAGRPAGCGSRPLRLTGSVPSSGVRLDEVDYDLPEDRIAQVPIEPRDAAKLLVDRGSAPPEHRTVADLPDLLAPGDVVVVNDTRVIPARLRLQRDTGGAAEV